MNDLEPAHVDDDPEHVRLPHEEGGNTQDHSPYIVQEARALEAHTTQMIPIGDKHEEGRDNVGVVEAGEEEDYREECDVESRVKRVP